MSPRLSASSASSPDASTAPSRSILELEPPQQLKLIRSVPFAQRLSHEVGWSYRDVVDRLEEKRKVKTAAFHERKVAALKAKTAALKNASSAAPISEKLAVYGSVASYWFGVYG